MPPSSAQRREPAAACSPYGERRKARNRNTIPPMGVGVKKRATPSTARITEAIVSRTAQISNRNTSRAARRDNAKAKGATNIFSSIFIFKTSFIYPFYLYFIMPARGHKCCERLVNPVLKLRVMLARSGKKEQGGKPRNGSLPPSSYFAISSESSRSTFDTSPHSFS